MRDTLTVAASLVILVLAAALAVPPLVDWEARRGMIEGWVARAAGLELRTEGGLDLRLLPAPRLRAERVRLGSEGGPTLHAEGVEAEIGLTPLLRGEVRLTQVRAGRLEIGLPRAEAGLRLPPRLLDEAARQAAIALDDLRVDRLTVTVAGGGSTDQFHAEALRVAAGSPLGPFTVEGTLAGAPFRLGTGVLGPERTMQARLAGGGNLVPRFDLDTRLSLVPDGDGLLPVLAGTARVFLGPPAQVAAAGLPIPVLLQATFKTAADRIELEPLSAEAGEGGASLRLAGTGTIRLDEPLVRVKLEGRRLDVDSFILSPSGRALLAAGEGAGPPLPGVPLEFDLAINSLGLAQEELSDLRLRGRVERGALRLDGAEVTGPGRTRVALRGEAGRGTGDGLGGRFTLASEASDRFGRYLNRLGLPGRYTAFMDGRRVEASGEVALQGPALSLRTLAITAGEARLTGDARLVAPEGGARGRLEARVQVAGADLAELPRVAELFDAASGVDVDLALDARDVRHGGRPGAGRIAARILSDGPALDVRELEITDLAGANARARGRIEPDGSGRITGQVSAPRAAPLIDLVGNVWMGGVSHLIPAFLRERELRLGVSAERARPDPASGEPRLRTVATGVAAGGELSLEAVTGEGRTQTLALRLATANTGAWVDKPDLAVLRRPSAFELRGARVTGGAFTVTASGDIGGVRVATTRPLLLGESDDVVEGGEIDLAAADVTPFLILLGDGAGLAPPVPFQARVALGREADSSLVTAAGRAAGEAFSARLLVRSRQEFRGEVGVERLSLPWLVASLALNPGPDPNATAAWSTARFGQAARLFGGGTVQVQARRALLGRGLEAEEARFTLGLVPDGLEIRDLSAALAGGELRGTLRVARQESQATLSGEGRLEAPLSGLVPGSPFGGRLQASLRFGAAGETLSALVNNLGGAGEVGIAAFTAPGADPGAIDRALGRLLAEPDPLRPRHVESVVAEELRRGPFAAPLLAAPATIAGGVIRLNPVRVASGPATWRGAVALDLRNGRLDAAGALAGATLPPRWLGSPPAIGLAWRGPVGAPTREVDAGPLASGVAALVLQRELDQIDRLQAEAEGRPRPSPPHAPLAAPLAPGEGAAAPPGAADALVLPAPPRPVQPGG